VTLDSLPLGHVVVHDCHTVPDRLGFLDPAFVFAV
jgi:hypothetical protein